MARRQDVSYQAEHDRTVMARSLVECRAKLVLSHDRESVHASAAAMLDERVVEAIEFLDRVLDPRKPVSQARLRKRLLGLQRRLIEAHLAAAAPVQVQEIPLVRLGPGGDYIRDIMEDDV